MTRVTKATAVMAVLASLALAPSMALAAPIPVHPVSGSSIHTGLFDMILQMIGITVAPVTGHGMAPTPGGTGATRPVSGGTVSPESAIWGGGRGGCTPGVTC